MEHLVVVANRELGGCLLRMNVDYDRCIFSIKCFPQRYAKLLVVKLVVVEDLLALTPILLFKCRYECSSASTVLYYKLYSYLGCTLRP